MTLKGWTAALAAAGLLALAGCGGGSDNSSSSSGASSGGSSSSSSSSSGGGGQAIKLAADPSGKLAFDKKTLKAKAGDVTIDFSNSSGVPHAVAVQGNGVNKSGSTITSGSNTLALNLKPGKYEFYCPVDGHRQAGMKGTLIVK
jgi:plastocyanin